MLLLSLLVFLPSLFAIIIWFFPSERSLKPLAIGLAVLEFGLSLLLLKNFELGAVGLQFVEKATWIHSLGINYFLGVDGISIWLVILTTFLTPITLLGAWTGITKKLRGFLVAMFLLETTMLGTFLAMDAILFYCFFEISLVPMYFLIGIWGGPRRIYATMKFFLYTMAGSVLMLLSIIYMMYLTQGLPEGLISASILDFYRIDHIPFIGGQFFSTQTLLFFGFALAFAIKVPLFPFHTWLPDAHVEAPTAGSVILAGVMLKMGTYGFIRLVIPMFPEAAAYWSWLFLFLGAFGIIYGALVAMVQPDIKKLVAYSSVSHMGYVVLGLFALNSYGMAGGLFQMLNHGISTGALFLMVGMIYERTQSREIKDYGGLAVEAPIFTILFLIVTFSSIAVPMTNGFVGEFLILLGAYKANPTFAMIAVIGVILGASYMLWLVKKIFFGPEGRLVAEKKAAGLDLNLREMVVLAPLIVLIFWMGLFPGHFLQYTKASLDHLVFSEGKYELTIHVPGKKLPDSQHIQRSSYVKKVKSHEHF